MEKEDSINYLRSRLLSIDKVQADKFFPDRIEGECSWCGRKCYGIKESKPDICSYCFVELKESTRRVDSLERLVNAASAVKWAKEREERWILKENQKLVSLDGCSFNSTILFTIPTKKQSDRSGL